MVTDGHGPSTPSREPPGQRPGGCLLRLVFLWVEFTVFIVIAALVAEEVAPALRARGYDTDIGKGFLIAAGLGCAMAIYPALWLHRLLGRGAGRS